MKKVELKEIPIDKIKVLRNPRTEPGDVAELMVSMKQYGLLQPIGTWTENGYYILSFGHRRLEAAKKLGWVTISALVSNESMTEQEFILYNFMENWIRKELTPVEAGRTVQDLLDLGLTISEISAKSGVNKSRLKDAHIAFLYVPLEFRSKISWLQGNIEKKGLISASINKAIRRLRVPEEMKKQVYAAAIKKELTIRQINLLDHMLRLGISFDKAIQEVDNCRVILPAFIMQKQTVTELEHTYNKRISQIIRAMVMGRIPLNPKFFVE